MRAARQVCRTHVSDNRVRGATHAMCAHSTRICTVLLRSATVATVTQTCKLRANDRCGLFCDHVRRSRASAPFQGPMAVCSLYVPSLIGRSHQAAANP